MANGLWRHSRFFFAIGFGCIVAGLASLLFAAWQMQALLGANSFFMMYLGLSAHLGMSTTSQDLKRQAAADDEGIVFIVLLAVGAVVVSLGVIVWVLNSQDTRPWQAALALSAVPLGWGTIHTVAAFRYAHMYYSTKSPGGLVFPGTKDPNLWDFYYVSYVIGMTAQVSDVIVDDQGIRKMVLLHAIGAFFYNTVILALSVNAGLALGNP
jgi:uncharacterized membrane protein